MSLFRHLTSPKFRSALVAGVVIACVLGLSQAAMAAAGDTAAPATHDNIFLKILDWTVVVVLVLASVAGVALIIDAVIHIKEGKIVPVESTEHMRSLINSRQFKELMDFTSTDQSFVSTSLNSALRRAHLGYPAMREAMESTANEQTANWFRRIEILNVIGNIGPLIGLLGTVLGMIMAFQALNAAGGQAKPEQLAGGISTALGHTFGGLFVAIPCLLVYGFYRTKIDKITSKATLLTEELLESLRPEEKKAPAAAARPAASAARRPATADE